jgi:EAL domain-containing protein (putative c-di-GMP-specific phosphodiesterase class I)
LSADPILSPGRQDIAKHLYLFPQKPAVVQRIVDHLKRTGVTHQVAGDLCIVVTATDAESEHLVCDLRNMGPWLGQTTRYLYMECDRKPNLDDFSRVGWLSAFTGARDARWLGALMDEGRLTSFYQPIVHAKTPERVYAHEALLRGIDKDGSIMSPVPVLDVAREVGRLPELDLMARNIAIRNAAELQLPGCIFINFSPAAIGDLKESLRQTIRSVARAGIDASRVVFEITETDRVPDVSLLQELVRAYRGYGFRVALDDVGSGYSSLNLIHKLQPDIVKLDMELIRGVHLDPYRAGIASRILSFAQETNILTVAEGIETAEEMAWVAENGADFVQGYFIARPTANPTSRSEVAKAPVLAV